MNRPKIEDYERDVLCYTYNERVEDLERCVKDLNKYIDELEEKNKKLRNRANKMSKRVKELEQEIRDIRFHEQIEEERNEYWEDYE